MVGEIVHVYYTTRPHRTLKKKIPRPVLVLGT